MMDMSDISLGRFPEMGVPPVIIHFNLTHYGTPLILFPLIMLGHEVVELLVQIILGHSQMSPRKGHDVLYPLWG